MTDTSTGTEVANTTRREFSIDKLDRDRADKISVSAIAGGVSFGSALEVLEMAKLMALADKAVPKHLRNNPGACLAIVFQAIEWRMSPFAVANKSYEVNDRIAYESQLIHAVIEARAPLRERLDCAYDGVGPEKTCEIVGKFLDNTERRYKSPMIKDIKVKNSPLWTSDPEQQLFYYASRAWARRWCPDVLMGIYSRDELLEEPGIGREEPAEAGLHARLAGSERPAEGFQHGNGHVERELGSIAAGGGKVELSDEEKAARAQALGDAKAAEADEARKTEPAAAKPKRSTKKDKTDPQPEGAEPVAAALPKNPEQYIAYADTWLRGSTDGDAMDARWAQERKMRNDCGVTAEDRKSLEDLKATQYAKLTGEAG